MGSTIDRQRRHDEKWQAEVIDGMNRVLAVLHDISDGIRDLTQAVRTAEQTRQPPPAAAERVQSDYSSIRDLAELLGISEAAVRGLRQRGEGPTATKVGRRLRFRRHDVDRWLASRREDPVSRTRPWKQAWMGGGIGTGLARTTAPPSYCSGSHTEPVAASRYQGMGICRVCGDDVSVIKNGTLRKHRRYTRW
jgi:excisionase family DNA binding protein